MKILNLKQRAQIRASIMKISLNIVEIWFGNNHIFSQQILNLKQRVPSTNTKPEEEIIFSSIAIVQDYIWEIFCKQSIARGMQLTLEQFREIMLRYYRLYVLQEGTNHISLLLHKPHLQNTPCPPRTSFCCQHQIQVLQSPTR